MSLFSKSTGTKRSIAAFLNLLLNIIATHPALQPLTQLVTWLATFFGVTGLAHAASEGTIQDFKLVSLSSLFSLLVQAVQSFPQLQAYQGYVTLLGSLLSALGLLTAAVSKK